MTQIVNDCDDYEICAFKLNKRQKAAAQKRFNFNLSNKIIFNRIQEIKPVNKNQTYVTQSFCQYIIQKNIQELLPIINNKEETKIKFAFVKLRFFCSKCLGLGFTDWITMTRDGRALKNSILNLPNYIYKNSGFYNIFNYSEPFLIRSICKKEKGSEICPVCLGSGLQPEVELGKLLFLNTPISEICKIKELKICT